MFERLTHNQVPWVQESRDGKGKQRFGQCPECDGAMLGPYSRLTARPGHRLNLVFGLRDHEIKSKPLGELVETIDFYVARSAGADGNAGQFVFEKTIELRSEEFLDRVAHKSRPSGYGLKLVETARSALISYLNDHPEAAEFKETPDA